MIGLNGTCANPLLICKVGGESYAIQVDCVLELLALQKLNITPLPGMPSHVEGMINLRGQTLCVQNIRTMFGMTSLKNENDAIIEMLEERKRDHIFWLDQLDASVHQGTEFQLATDPHECKFGKWYDQLLADPEEMNRFARDQIALVDIMSRFNGPHQRIHAIAEKVTALVAKGDTEKANAIIEHAKANDLQELLELFSNACDLVQRFHIGVVVVVERDNKRAGLVVDSVCDVKEFQKDNYLPHNLLGGDDWIQGFVQDEETKDLIQVIRLDMISGFAREKSFAAEELAAVN
ncbi:chemotaxis protein CheW [Stieleria sp. JC731]|uniref:chemotaxis protein CheW n=1 Tax=Pirellulaceae TaxID=2691357 RepID=UPI001E328FD3|nr:chemotaxis protein CheW [Stieleria sp. JC731]MCC9599166.1 chemotaxis protein CheW [Stieleria sp. JC731]